MIARSLKMSLDAPPRLGFASSLCLRVVLATILLFSPRLFSQGTSDPPQITAQPQDQSVSSGSNVVISVSAIGTQPLGFQWRAAAYGATPTNIAKANSATLTFSNVSVLNAGFYSVVVTNAFGAVTSVVAHLSVDEDKVFRIAALQTNGFIVTEAFNVVGYTRGGMAVSSNNVFLTGYGQNFNVATTGHWRKQDLSSGALAAQGYDALASDLRTEKAYTLANGTTPLAGPGTVNALLEISDAGAITANRVNLSTNITISGNEAGIFAGYGRVVLYDSGRFYDISMPSGVVTYLGTRRISHNYPYYGNPLEACWGLAEYFRGDIYVICGQGSSIYRYRVRDGFNEVLAAFGPFEQGLSSIYCLTFSPSLSRWFFHYPYEGLFGPLTTTLGSAKALFTRDSAFPDITQDPQSVTVNAGDPATLSVSATGDNLTYQWRFNSGEIDGATNATLSISNALPANAGTYRVAVSTAAGTTVSKPAVLTVLTLPVIAFGPGNIAVEANSNVTNSITALGPPPLTYQWRFNGTALLGETNTTIRLTNLQASQQGVYTVVVSNSWGSTISPEGRLRLITIFPETASFRIANLSASNSKVIDDRNVISYEYGGMACARNRLLHSGSSALELLDLEDLSNPGTGTLYPTIASDLRTGTAYAFVQNSSSIAYGGVATHLLEMDETTGRTNGRRLALSSPIPMPSTYPDYMNVGFFSGYGRILVYNETNVFSILLPSGTVSNLGTMGSPTHYSSGWGYWGVAEYVGGTNYLVYVRDSQTISRTRVPDGSTTVLGSFQNLSSMSHFTVSLYHNRWYFHYPGTGQFGGVHQTLGYADATFDITPVHHYQWAPIASPQAMNSPFNVSLSARAADNSIVSNYTGSAIVSGISGGANVPLVPTVVEVSVVNGVWNGQVTVPDPHPAMNLNAADDRGIVGNSGTFEVLPQNDLYLTIVDAPDPIVVNQLLSYTIHVNNTGPTTATGVLLSNFLDPTVVFQSVNTSVGSCTNDNGVVRCNLGDISAAAGATVVIQVIPAAAGSITNRATIARNESDANTTNNTAIAVTTVNLPALSINDISVIEGNSGTNFVTFNVTLSAPATNTVTVNFNSFNGTATSGSGDYIATNGLLTFLPGITNQTIQVGVRGDTLYETNEIFNVGLNSAVNAIVARTPGVCTIINDDPAPVVFINDASLVEGNSGTNNMGFQVWLSARTGLQILVNYSTSNGTATAGSDYVPATNGAISFGAGSTTITQFIQVGILGDTRPESNEFFYVNINSISNAQPAGRTQVIGTILNDDGSNVLDHFTFDPIPSPQAVAVAFPITLTAKDFFETTITNFSGTSALSALADFEAVTNVAIGDIDSNSSGSGDFTIGIAFTPSRDIQMTHFRHFWGTKMSIWSDNGTLLASQPTTGTEGTWTETPLPAPLTLTAGSHYRLAAYSAGGNYYLASGFLPTEFTDGTIDQNVYAGTDAFPTNLVNAFFQVDFRYKYESYIGVSLDPTNSGAFTNGAWSGSATLFSAATNVALRARSTGQIAGVSVPFDVFSADQSDLQALLSAVQPARFITNFDYILSVSNAGPASASSVLLTHAIPSELQFVSAVAGPPLTCSFSNGMITCAGVSLAPRSSGSVAIRTQPLQAGVINLSATASASQTDPKPGNNTASLAVTICRDCDGDGMWDDWELAHNLNPYDPSDGALDNDHDGQSNLQEFLAGTDPNSSNSVMRVSVVGIAGNQVQIAFVGVSGKQYSLERTEGLGTSNWTSVVTFNMASSGNTNLFDSAVSSRRGSFYRIRLLP